MRYLTLQGQRGSDFTIWKNAYGLNEMAISRRGLLKAALASACSGLVFGRYTYGDPDEARRENAKTDIFRDQALLLQDKYQIDTYDNAMALQLKISELEGTAASYAAGTASLIRSALVESLSEEQNAAPHNRLAKALMPAVLTGVGTAPVSPLSSLFNDSDLASPSFVRMNYGMSMQNAKQFCADYKASFSTCSVASSMIIAGVQEYALGPRKTVEDPDDTPPADRDMDDLDDFGAPDILET